MLKWFFFLMVISAPVFGQRLIEGKLVDAVNGEPVPFASIGIVGTSKGTSSNVNGEFSLSVTEPFSIKITCIGFESLTVNSDENFTLIKLKPAVTELNAIIILSNPMKAKKVLQKAFARIHDNYSTDPFFQKFFYRHYCKDNEEYGRLIEASVDVWKDQGYRYAQSEAGEKEEIRVTHLRRSLDKTEMAQGHEPIAIGNALEADIVAYQTASKSDHLSFYTHVSDLRTDMENYSFTGLGVTSFDGHEVYQITYSYKKDSALTTSGKYLQKTEVVGTLYITTDSYTFVKAEETKTFGRNTIRSSAYYQKFGDKFYPYHFIRDSESYTSDNDRHEVHLELMAVELNASMSEKFKGHLPNKEELLNIPYDSSFWATNTILKATPLENAIIRDLGGGASLDKQFYRYRQYELNTRDGGKDGEAKFNWLRADSKGDRILYLIFWSGDFQSYRIELERAKQLKQLYHSKITFVLLSVDDDESRWRQAVQKLSLYAGGVINYRIGSNSQLAKSLAIKEIPSFVLLARSGEVFDSHAKRPSDPLLVEDLKSLIDQK